MNLRSQKECQNRVINNKDGKTTVEDKPSGKIEM